MPRPVLPTDAVRSALMSRVRQRGTSAELIVAKALREYGFAYRLNVRSLSGAPDFANKSRKWAIFVHGCYWHHHTSCRRATVPKRNREFWLQKFASNRRRDAKAIRALRELGYHVVLVWECHAEDPSAIGQALSQMAKTRLVKR